MKFTKENGIVKIEDLKKVHKYPYKHYNRFSDEKGRKYLVDEQKVPSVTTIIGATKDQSFLDDWRRRVGALQARKRF